MLLTAPNPEFSAVLRRNCEAEDALLTGNMLLNLAFLVSQRDDSSAG